MQEGVLARVHARLRRQLDAARGQRAVGALDEVELGLDVGQEAGDLGPAQEEEPAQATTSGSTSTFTRTSPGLRQG